MASKMATQQDTYDISGTGTVSESKRCVRNDGLTDFGFSSSADRADNQLVPVDELAELLLVSNSVTYNFSCNPTVSTTNLGIAMYVYVDVGNTRFIEVLYEPDAGSSDCSEDGDASYTGSNTITFTIADQGSSDDYTVVYTISYTDQSGNITTKNNQSLSVGVQDTVSVSFTADDVITEFTLYISRIY